MSAGAWEHATRECQGGRWSGVARTFLYLNLANWIEPQFFDCTRLKVEVSAPSQVQGPTSKAKAQEPRLFNGEGRGQCHSGQRAAPDHAPLPGWVCRGSSSYLVAFLTK